MPKNPVRKQDKCNLATMEVLVPDNRTGDGDTLQYLTEYHYAWWSETEDPDRIDNVKMVTFSIDSKGNIFERDGSPEADILARRKSKKKLGSKKERDIISLAEFDRLFPDEEAAITFIEDTIWQGVPVCPKCEATNAYMPKSGKPMRWRCRACKRYFSVFVNTPMEKSPIPAKTWLKAIHLMHTGRKGISALQLHKMLGIAYQHTWHLEMRIRKAMEPDDIVLAGIVEIDETNMGGDERWKHANKKLHERWREGKVLVMGFRDHTGKTILFPIPNNDRETLERAIMAKVEPGSTIYTDGHTGYAHLSQLGYNHEWVNHSVGEFVNGMATTNGIESCWALLKKGYVGTFHWMSAKHLYRYCAEFMYRLNSGPGNGPKIMGATLRSMVGKRLTWDDLVYGPEDGTPLETEAMAA
ncbi:MAG: IS1595 family transposase [Chloroflexi bacterium]|nr:IS1595 family transposase [Chloroflexota bacterium]